MQSLVRKTLVAALLGLAAGAAGAATSSSATFGTLVITLTDLDPHDGVAASLTFQTQGHAYVLGEALGWGESAEEALFAHTAPRPQGALGDVAATSWSSANASLMAADTVAGFSTLSASGAALSGLDGYGAYRSYATGQDPFLNQFTLSAHTMVTFSTMATLQSQTSMGYNLEADQGEYANAHALLLVTGSSLDGQEYVDGHEVDVTATFNVRDDGSTEGVKASWSGLLSASLSNDTAFQANGELHAFVSTEGVSAVWDGVTPVPEPSSYAMLLGGLLLLGGVAKRRARPRPAKFPRRYPRQKTGVRSAIR
ncbi:MAG: PEP-CTERM sorting domain-containing protein [Sphingomonadaceae bacterium]